MEGKPANSFRTTLRQTFLVVFFGVPVVGIVVLTMSSVEFLMGRSPNDVVNSGIGTFVAMMTVRIYQDRIFHPSRQMIYIAALGYLIISIALWVLRNHLRLAP